MRRGRGGLTWGGWTTWRISSTATSASIAAVVLVAARAPSTVGESSQAQRWGLAGGVGAWGTSGCAAGSSNVAPLGVAEDVSRAELGDGSAPVSRAIGAVSSLKAASKGALQPQSQVNQTTTKQKIASTFPRPEPLTLQTCAPVGAY